MKKRWLTIVCAFCMTGMLAACGAEDEIQMVEKEDIDLSSTAQVTEPSAEEETKMPEEEKESEEPETDMRAESDSGETTAGKPAVVSIETEKEEYKDGDRILLVTNYDNVTVSFEGNEAAGQAVMAEFAKRKKGFEEGLRLEETLEDARENPVVDGHVYYYEEYWYTRERNDGRILSFSAMWDTYEGGAHGQYMVYGVNFDAATGKVLQIEDIASDMESFQEICVQEMLRQCEILKAQGALFDESMLPGGLQGILEGKMEGEEWYFTEEGIRFISNVYEIGPYAAGSFEFDIPYEMINETLHEAYRG